MDRGRDHDRDRRADRESEGVVTKMGAGESYRPTARTRSPPRADLFRSSDRPPSDSYHPGGRDRSPRRRSPYRRERSLPRDNWRVRSPPRDRARSPPRRFSPRRDDRRERARTPRDERRRSRSPFDRDRPNMRARSPLPLRVSSPGARNSHRPRSRTPDRRDDRAPSGPASSNWRRRTPSPAVRESERSGRTSGRTSGSNSRRSSPQVHPSRMPGISQGPRARSPPMIRERSPPPIQIPNRGRDSAISTPRERSPTRPAPRSPPRGPAAFRAPTGPGSSSRNSTAPTPAPSNNPLPISAHNRQENASPVVPPAGPRGYMGPARGTYMGRGSRGSFGSGRQPPPDTSSWGAAPSRPVPEASRGSTPVNRSAPAISPSVLTSPAPSIPTGPSGGIPTGPRAGTGIPTRAPPSIQHSSSVYSRNQSISGPASGPRPHPAMGNLPQIITGGRIDPTASGVSMDVALRLKKREEEAELLREDLKAKEEKLRKSLKTWDKLSRDSSAMALRSELSERHVRMLAGEGVGGAAF